jgi:hypothetical protein
LTLVFDALVEIKNHHKPVEIIYCARSHYPGSDFTISRLRHCAFTSGFDNNRWRTDEEVGDMMNLTRERVRQLLLPSKLALSRALAGTVPWRALNRKIESKMRRRERILVKH